MSTKSDPTNITWGGGVTKYQWNSGNKALKNIHLYDNMIINMKYVNKKDNIHMYTIQYMYMSAIFTYFYVLPNHN